jgi:glycosyltransferase involved in cell wall biosynthesis
MIATVNFIKFISLILDYTLKVYLDCSPLTNPQVSGIGVYNKNLFLELKNQLHNDVLPVLKWSRLKKSSVVESHIHHPVTALAPFLFNKSIVYHGTDHKLNTWSRGPKVVTIHDMQPFVGKWIDPKFAQGRIEIMTKVFKSDVQKIIAISHFTKQEIIRFFPEAASKIEVVYHGHNFDLKTEPLVLSNNIIEKITQGKPFLFFIGNIEERKNLVNQIKAFEILKEDNKDLVFILSGKPGFNFSMIEAYINSSIYKSDIYVTGYLSEAEKEYALKHTACLMFASWYEGFGFPLIEALAKNSNVVISQSSSLHEIGKEYCYECDPADPLDIADKVSIIIKKGNLKKVDLYHFQSEWSWKKCALETIDVYKKSY